MIDFDKAKRTFSGYAGSERKTARIYNDVLYMVKLPDPPRGKTLISYKNNQYSGYMGCHIFESCGFKTQETVLGTLTDSKEKQKVVVGCRDFTQDGAVLYEFEKLGDADVDSENRFTTSIEDVKKILEQNDLIKDKEKEFKEKFWDMFVIDALIGNTDRHLNNWGILVKDDEVEFAPIYDCGSTLGALYSDDMMEEMMSSPTVFKNKEFNIASCYFMNGKKVFYHEIFKDPPPDLAEAIKRTIPKIDMNKIYQVIDSVGGISDIRKEYLKAALDMRNNLILQPSLKNSEKGKHRFISNQENLMKKIIQLHKDIKHLDKSLIVLHPIAVVRDNIFYVFDIDEYGENYQFILEKENPVPMPIPEDVLAAFPLDFYENKSVAVIGENILNVPNNYVFLFHEFVHCYVGDNYEASIRKNLTIEKQQREANNMMWELNYQFPYDDDVFIEMTVKLNNASDDVKYETYINYHKAMKSYLSVTDFEYMVWQEWKEGFARYVENLIREKIGMEKNRNVLSQPFDRVTFYEIGSSYIDLLLKQDSELKEDVEKLFYKMLQ